MYKRSSGIVKKNIRMRDGWKIVMVATLPQEIYLARALLDAEGIETLLEDELTAQVNNFYSNAIGGVKLLVPEVDAGRSADLLAQGGYVLERPVPESPLENVPAADRNRCPYCGSENIGKERRGEWPMLVFYAVLGVLLPIFRPVYHCFDCGRNWRFRKG